MKMPFIAIFFLCILSQIGSRFVFAEQLPPLQTVPFVDLKKYIGTWYEIARFPNSFQKKCVGNVTATYSLREDGDIAVVNRCMKKDGSYSESNGKAWVTDSQSQSKLRVQFFWPFSGQYWIILLGPNYEYAVVSESDRKYLWILSRQPTLYPEVYEKIIKALKNQYFDLGSLQPTSQNQAN